MPYKNKEDRRRNSLKNRTLNPEKYRRIQKEWRLKNPQKDKQARLREKLSLQVHPDRAEKRKLVAKQYRFNKRYEALKLYGGCCVCCGESLFEFLAFDYINNDGKLHRKIQGTDAFLHWPVKDKPNTIQILCHNCNCAKGFYGRCPHTGGALV